MNDPPSAILDEMQRDALTELINIGVSRAAANLRAMVDREVLLSVPSVEIVTRILAARRLDHHGQGRLVAIRQTFPEINSLEVVRAVTGGTLPLEDIVALEQEALAETGNIVLNSCLAAMANLLERTLRMSLPEILRGSGAKLFEYFAGNDPEDLVLVIHINFSIHEHEITGHIAMAMDLPALWALRELLDDLIRRTTSLLPSTSHVAP
jgi:chemotaxis protein CheC